MKMAPGPALYRQLNPVQTGRLQGHIPYPLSKNQNHTKTGGNIMQYELKKSNSQKKETSPLSSAEWYSKGTS